MKFNWDGNDWVEGRKYEGEFPIIKKIEIGVKLSTTLIIAWWYFTDGIYWMTSYFLRFVL